MNTVITIIGALGIALCLAPFIITNLKNKNKDSKIQTTISDYANQNGYKISEFEVKPKYALGIDKDNAKLFYLNTLNDKHSQNVEMIDLSEIDTSKIQIEKHFTSNKKEVIDKVLLNLIPKQNTAKTPSLVFYDSTVSFQFDGEMQSIQKWHNTISDLLN
ncbi:hypothetical protein [Winogradskyella marincola]|uniref:Lipoprotein n=1 Tax=Winogradskyella marincola TaxID=3037795 RepID=A0ABT6G4E7_9FLAO|nr:hypothetical protein [Winogradskyella sp. YYF002]MDG4716921.1 hypothetical protein [Winogradskyella sp. YYF002]